LRLSLWSHAQLKRVGDGVVYLVLDQHADERCQLVWRDGSEDACLFDDASDVSVKILGVDSPIDEFIVT
jgi:hypothetical protein